MSEFHFLRPEWLLVLPLAVWLAWRIGLGRGGRDGWRSVVDRVLQPFVLAGGERLNQRRWPVVTALVAAALAALALAGPTWDRLAVPAYRSDEALVVALDLSRSMDATDVAPSRLARARLKLLDLLERREGGQTALVVFTANAFTVSPLTTDGRTIASLVNALDSDIMPSRGSLIAVGLEKSASLLRQSGASRGEILLITDAVASPPDFSRAAELRGQGIRVHVLAVGTEDGAPIPNREGGFLTNDRGEVVVPQIDLANLRRLADMGGGRFARLATDDADLERLFPDTAAGALSAAGPDQDDPREADIWRDQGIWLVLALLPLVALGFRRGWVYCALAVLLLPQQRAEAFEWRDLWQRPDQQGAEALAGDAPAAAAELFRDPEWAAAARYRAGQYEASASELSGIDSADANYNRANALARNGQLEEAVAAYDRALELNPDHADAEYNRELVADLLEQQQQEQNQQQDQQQDQSGESEGGEDEQQGQQQDQSGESEGDDAGDQQQMADGSRGDQGQDQDQDQDPGQQQSADNQDSPGEQETDSPDESGDQQADAQQQAAATPEEIEDWASEQAADQWLRRIPQDPGGLLRRKFLYQYQQQGIDQDGNLIYPGSTTEPW
jgi:Ca-activated chloride channel family protein